MRDVVPTSPSGSAAARAWWNGRTLVVLGARAVWSGAISFGLVTVPIHVVSATEDHSIHFHQYHLAGQGRIRYRKVCEPEDREVPEDEIGKGYKLTKTQVIPVKDEDLSSLPLPTAKAIGLIRKVRLRTVADVLRAIARHPVDPREAHAHFHVRVLLERRPGVADRTPHPPCRVRWAKLSTVQKQPYAAPLHRRRRVHPDCRDVVPAVAALHTDAHLRTAPVMCARARVCGRWRCIRHHQSGCQHRRRRKKSLHTGLNSGSSPMRRVALQDHSHR